MTDLLHWNFAIYWRSASYWDMPSSTWLSR